MLKSFRLPGEALAWRRWLVLLGTIGLLVLTPGMRSKIFRSREAVDGRLHSASGSMVVSPTPPARLVHLSAGTRFQGDVPPEGWTHLVFKSVPRLTTGDLDTVSEQAFQIAQRIRPLMLASVRKSEGGDSYHLERVGVGLCAPGPDDASDVTVTGTSVDGTGGSWSAKQRLILAALALESSRIRLEAATPTFALVRSPVVFLAAGEHRKLDLLYALLLDAGSGELRTYVWPDYASASLSVPGKLMMRGLETHVFDLPQDVKATRIGPLPVAWSFAIRGFPDGRDHPGSELLPRLLATDADQADRSRRIEEALSEALQVQGSPSQEVGRGR